MHWTVGDAVVDDVDDDEPLNAFETTCKPVCQSFPHSPANCQNCLSAFAASPRLDQTPTIALVAYVVSGLHGLARTSAHTAMIGKTIQLGSCPRLPCVSAFFRTILDLLFDLSMFLQEFSLLQVAGNLCFLNADLCALTVVFYGSRTLPSTQLYTLSRRHGSSTGKSGRARCRGDVVPFDGRPRRLGISDGAFHNFLLK